MKKSYLVAALLGVFLMILVLVFIVGIRSGLKNAQPTKLAPFVYSNLDESCLKLIHKS